MSGGAARQRPLPWLRYAVLGAIFVAAMIFLGHKLDQESERPCRAGEVFVPRPGSRPPCFDKFTGRGFELEIRDHVALCVCRTAP